MAEKTLADSQGKIIDQKIDPTANVLSLVEAANKRQDDLRLAEGRRIDDLAVLRADHAKELAAAEAKRIDAIRAVDVNAVAVASGRAADQATVLATQFTQSAEALRTLVATTATTLAAQQQAAQSQVMERLTALERSQYEGQGKRSLEDPRMAELLDEVKRLSAARVSGSGEQTGRGVVWGYIFAAVAMAASLVAIIEMIRK